MSPAATPSPAVAPPAGPPVIPQPVPTAWAIKRARAGEVAFVVLELYTPTGVFCFFFDEAAAGRLASGLGQSARSGLAIASVVPR